MNEQEKNPFLIVETAVIRRNNPENRLGLYYVVARTTDGLLYERNVQPNTMDIAIMWADLLTGTEIQTSDWTSLVKIL